MGCDAVITEKAARAFYDQLLSARSADGCTLDEVETDKTRMTVLWKTGETSLPVAEVVRHECAAADAVVGPTLAIRVPEPLRAACPSAVTAAVAVVQRETFDAPPTTPRSPLVTVAVVLAVALAVVAFNVAMVVRHRAGPLPGAR